MSHRLMGIYPAGNRQRIRLVNCSNCIEEIAKTPLNGRAKYIMSIWVRQFKFSFGYTSASSISRGAAARRPTTPPTSSICDLRTHCTVNKKLPTFYLIAVFPIV